MEEIILVSNESGIRIDAWLCGKVKDYSRSYIQKLINDGMILVNGKPVKSNYKIKTKRRDTGKNTGASSS